MVHPLQSKQHKFWLPENWRPGLGINEDKWFKKNQRLLLWMANTDYGRDLLCIPKKYGQITAFRKNSVTFRKNRKELVTDFRIGAKWANVIRFRFDEFLKYAAYCEKDWKFLFKGFFVPQKFPAMGLTTDTFFPDPNPETTSVDGLVERVPGANEAFSTIRTSAGNGSDDSTDTAEGAFLYNASGSNYSHLYRGIFLFDTSTIPSSDTISSATLSFKGALGLDGYTQSASIVKTTPASNTSLANSDYNIANWDMTQQASDKTLASLDGTNYNDFALNATGISNIGKGASGMAKFGTVLSGDRTNTDPGSSSGVYSVWNIIKAEHTGTGSDPQLVVVHAAAATNVFHRLLFMGLGS